MFDAVTLVFFEDILDHACPIEYFYLLTQSLYCSIYSFFVMTVWNCDMPEVRLLILTITITVFICLYLDRTSRLL